MGKNLKKIVPRETTNDFSYYDEQINNYLEDDIIVTEEQEERLLKDKEVFERLMLKEYTRENKGSRRSFNRNMKYFTNFGSNYLFDLNKLYDTYCNHKQLDWRESTINNIGHILKPFIKWIYANSENLSTGMVLLNQEILNNYFAYRKESGISPYTINSQSKAIKAFLNWIIDFTDVPIKFNIRTNSRLKYEHDIYTDEELKQLLTPPKNKTFTAMRNHAIIAFLIGTGCRRSNIANIKIKDIDFNNCTVNFTTSKTDSYMVPLSVQLNRVLTKYINSFTFEENDYLFPQENGNPLKAEYITKLIARYNKSHGVPNKTSVHLYRHSYAHNYLQNNGNVFKLKRLLNHSTLDMVNVYANVEEVKSLNKGYSEKNLLDNITMKTGRKIQSKESTTKKNSRKITNR